MAASHIHRATLHKQGAWAAFLSDTSFCKESCNDMPSWVPHFEKASFFKILFQLVAGNDLCFFHASASGEMMVWQVESWSLKRFPNGVCQQRGRRGLWQAQFHVLPFSRHYCAKWPPRLTGNRQHFFQCCSSRHRTSLSMAVERIVILSLHDHLTCR